MINPEIQELINNQFNELPKVVQDTILNSNWTEKIRLIVKKHNLHIDQGAAIENLVFVTMLGIERPENFVQNAKEYANVTDNQAIMISEEVERTIFKDIRQELIRITETHDTVEEVDRVTDELSKAANEMDQIEKIQSGELVASPQPKPTQTETLLKKKPLSETLPKGSLEVAEEGTIPDKPVTKQETSQGTTPIPKPTTPPKPTHDNSSFKPVPPTSGTKDPYREQVSEEDLAKPDPIVAAKLSQKTSSAQERLEAELEENAVKPGEQQPSSAMLASQEKTQTSDDTPQSETPSEPKKTPQYTASDPYREPIE